MYSFAPNEFLGDTVITNLLPPWPCLIEWMSGLSIVPQIQRYQDSIYIAFYYHAYYAGL